MYSKRKTKQSIKRMIDGSPEMPQPGWVALGLVVLVVVVAWFWFGE